MLNSQKSLKPPQLPLVRCNYDGDHIVLSNSERTVAVKRYKINFILILIIVIFTSNCLLFLMSDRDCNQQFQPLSMVQHFISLLVTSCACKPVQAYRGTNHEIKWVLVPDLADSCNDEYTDNKKIPNTDGFCLNKKKVTSENLCMTSL